MRVREVVEVVEEIGERRRREEDAAEEEAARLARATGDILLL